MYIRKVIPQSGQESFWKEKVTLNHFTNYQPNFDVEKLVVVAHDSVGSVHFLVLGNTQTIYGNILMKLIFLLKLHIKFHDMLTESGKIENQH